jgi:hypothetical protein
MRRCLAISLAIGLISSTPGWGATVYMAPGASGSCTAASPCGSMNAAYQAAGLGDVVLMSAGNYGGQTLSPRSLPGADSVRPSGEEITFRPQPGAGVSVDGLILGASRSAPVEHVTFEDLTFTDWVATRSGVDVHFLRTSHRAQLHANWVEYLSYEQSEVGPFTDDTGDGLQFNQIDGRAGHHILVEGLRIHDVHPNNSAAHPDAVQWYGPYHQVTFRANRLWNNDNINLRGDGEMQDYVVENNFFGDARDPVVPRYYTAQIQGNGAVIRYNSFDGALQPSGTNERSGQVWEGNIMTWSTCSVTGDDSTVRFNVFVGGNTCGSNYKRVSDPGWVDGAAGDPRLRADSPAIGAGNPNSFPPTDFQGQARPGDGAPDAGADEYDASTVLSNGSPVVGLRKPLTVRGLRVKRVRRGRRVLLLRLSEPARVSGTLSRRRGSHYRVVRRLKPRRLAAGLVRIRLGRPPKGRYKLRIKAVASGSNRASATIRFRVRRR